MLKLLQDIIIDNNPGEYASLSECTPTVSAQCRDAPLARVGVFRLVAPSDSVTIGKPMIAAMLRAGGASLHWMVGNV